MQRKLMLAGLFAVMVLPASGARRVTVAQLEKVLTSTEAAHRTDVEAARQIGDLEVTERLTDRTLGHLAATHTLGPRTALALQLLADESAFLDPPAIELPATGHPDASAQERMLDAARAYSVETWKRMPNFFVTRVTNRFDDGPHVMAKGDWPVRAGLQPAGSSSRQVTFRDGKETEDTAADSGLPGKTEQEVGLHSWGEFGPELTVVLADLSKQKLEFAHWEQIDTRLAAVFRYEVPRDASHYSVTYCCVVNQEIARTQTGIGGRNRGTGQAANVPQAVTANTYVETPGYGGTIAIDPATGAVLRITIQAQLSPNDPLLRAETLVDYGPAQIGDREFICPRRSIALSVRQYSLASVTRNDAAWESTLTNAKGVPILLINETKFTNYHRLGSTIRILNDAAANAPNSPAAGARIEAAQPMNAAVETSGSLSAPAAQPTPEVPVAAAAPPPPPPPPAPAPPAEPAIPEISMSTANNVPDQAANTASSGDSGFSIKVTSRLVDVGLVAYDKKGHPVTDLKPEDLEVYDNGHKQELRSFGMAEGAQPAKAAAQAETGDQSAPEAQAPSFTNRATDGPAGSASASSEIGSTILVLDESHIAWNDLNYARGQILKFLGSLAPGERVGLYTMTSYGFRVLTEVTTDHAALIARMQKFMPSAQSMSQAQEEETRNRQHFDEVHNVADLNSVNGNHTEVPESTQPVDPQLLTMGDDPTRASFVILTQVARHLASIPGHKKLVWVSSDNVLADWRDQAVGIDKSTKDDSNYGLHAQEAMNEAHAAVYPFDVSQLEAGGVSADLQHQQVQLTQAASEAASLGGGSSPRNVGPGRVVAAMSQDLHPVQGPVRQVAAATGGRVIRRSGDLTAQLDRIIDDGHSTYMLSFSPQGQADGQYHTINIKVNGRRGLTLSYRTGYVFEKEPTSLGERFRQAIWRPADMSEIAVSANVSAAGDRASVQINIATKDLGLRQQADRWMDRLDIFFIQRDDAGLHVRVDGQTLGLRLKSATYEKLIPEGFRFEHFVAAKPGMASLRVLVVDENSGRMGSVTIPSSAMSGGQGE